MTTAVRCGALRPQTQVGQVQFLRSCSFSPLGHLHSAQAMSQKIQCMKTTNVDTAELGSGARQP